MTPATEIQSVRQKTFDFILFRLEPFLLGTAATQIIRIRNSDIPQTDSDVEVLNLREIFHLPPNEQTGFSPTFLEVSGGPGRTYVSVDSAEGIIALNLSQIRKLSPLIDLHKSHSFLWGLALLDEKIAFLLDLDQLKPENKCQGYQKRRLNADIRC